MLRVIFLFVGFSIFFTVNAKVLTAHAGWTLLGNDSDFTVSELNQSCVDIAWKYNNDTWSAYSSKPAINSAIVQNSISTFSQIDGGTGFWVKGNDDNCTIDTLANTNTNYIRSDFNSSYSGQTPCDDIGLDSTKGTIYYVCGCDSTSDADCVAGSDSNDGLSPLTPWSSYEKARSQFSQLLAGDSIAFCKGGSFQVESNSRWVNTQCQADKPCVIRDYEPTWASGDESFPTITSSSGAFSFVDGGDANHEEGVTLLNFNLRGSGSGYGVFLFNDIDDVEMCNLSIKDFSIGVYLADSNPPEADSDGKNSRITLRNSEIADNHDQGWLGGSDETIIAYNSFQNNGFSRAIFNHNIYYSSHHEVNSTKIIGNSLYQSAMVDSKCSGTSLVAHGILNNLLIAGNRVEEDIGGANDGCWGIAVDEGGYEEPESFKNIVIKDNIVKNVGNIAIGVSNCQDCSVENNTIIQRQSITGRAIVVPDRTSDINDLPLNNVNIRNNTIVVGQNANLAGIFMGGEGKNHVVVSNAIFSEAPSINCFELPLSINSYDAVNNNLCYSSQTLIWEATQNLILSEWQSATNFDLNSTMQNPLFTDVNGDDFSTNSQNSPLVDAGHPTLSTTTSATQKTRDVKPDIGAHEF